MNSSFAFFGSPHFSRVILEALIDGGYIPAIVVCNPDAPVGRKQILTPPETKIVTMENHLPTQILQPQTKKELTTMGNEFHECEYAIVAAYARIIPQEILSVFPKGVIGVHPSLLPHHRGPSPIQQSILDGDETIGVTLYQMDNEVDHGAIINKREVPCSKTQSYREREQELAELAGQLLLQTLPSYLAGDIKPTPQHHKQATHTKKFTTQDGEIDIINDNPETIARTILALNPEPSVFTVINNKRIKLNAVEQQEEQWVITSITPEGKKPRTVHITLPYSSNEHTLS